jgi:hypothetical protein
MADGARAETSRKVQDTRLSGDSRFIERRSNLLQLQGRTDAAARLRSQLLKRPSGDFNATVVGENPTVPPMRPRVIGRDVVEVQNGAYVVAVLNGGGRLQCSGVLVDRRHVLSAKHCLCDTRRPHVRTQLGWVAFGPHVDDRLTLVPIEAARVLANVECPMVETPTEPDLVDLVVFRLRRAAPAQVEPVPIRMLATQAKVAHAAIAGYGRDNDGRSGRKLAGKVTISTPDCRDLIDGRSDSDRYECAPGLEAVAQGDPAAPVRDRSDTCRGDSGGPMLIPSDSETESFFRRDLLSGKVTLDGRMAVTAIASRGYRLGRVECGLGGIYTVITRHVIEWLHDEGVRPNLIGGQASPDTSRR